MIIVGGGLAHNNAQLIEQVTKEWQGIFSHIKFYLSHCGFLFYDCVCVWLLFVQEQCIFDPILHIEIWARKRIVCRFDIHPFYFLWVTYRDYFFSESKWQRRAVLKYKGQSFLLHIMGHSEQGCHQWETWVFLNMSCLIAWCNWRMSNNSFSSQIHLICLIFNFQILSHCLRAPKNFQSNKKIWDQ